MFDKHEINKLELSPRVHLADSREKICLKWVRNEAGLASEVSDSSSLVVLSAMHSTRREMSSSWV
jgi:hypothetical protein